MLRLEPIQKHSEQKKNRPLQEEVSDFFYIPNNGCQFLVADSWLPDNKLLIQSNAVYLMLMTLIVETFSCKN